MLLNLLNISTKKFLTANYIRAIREASVVPQNVLIPRQSWEANSVPQLPQLDLRGQFSSGKERRVGRQQIGNTTEIKFLVTATLGHNENPFVDVIYHTLGVCRLRFRSRSRLHGCIFVHFESVFSFKIWDVTEFTLEFTCGYMQHCSVWHRSVSRYSEPNNTAERSPADCEVSKERPLIKSVTSLWWHLNTRADRDNSSDEQSLIELTIVISAISFVRLSAMEKKTDSSEMPTTNGKCVSIPWPLRHETWLPWRWS